MMQGKDGSKKFFFDTYALYAVAQGSENYKRFANAKIVTTALHVLELQSIFEKIGATEETKPFIDMVFKETLPLGPKIIKKTAEFRKKMSKKNYSYADALGYVYAKELEIPFLTGDRGFKGMPNVNFLLE